jgi:hypothetical protein
MNHGILKQIILFGSALALVTGFVLFAGNGRAAAASSQATHYCQHKAAPSACEQGYDGGGKPPAETVQDACGNFGDNTAEQQSCQAAWAHASNEDPAVYCGASNCDFVAKYVNPAINLFSLSFGLIAVISLILGGIQYSASEGDPQKAAAAKSRISNTIIAIFAYLFFYVFLQFLIPGGAFH